MKRSRYSPATASMICSSRPVPRVVTTSAWVSPRVNSAEPWVRGSTPTRMSIGRTVRVSRPSIRGSPDRMRARTTFDSRSKMMLLTVFLSNSRPSAVRAACTSSPMADSGWERACLAVMRKASSILAAAISVTRAIRASSLAGACQSHFGLAGDFDQFVDGVDGGLHLGVAEHHAAQHHVFRQLEGFGFDHQHGGFGTGTTRFIWLVCAGRRSG